MKDVSPASETCAKSSTNVCRTRLSELFSALALLITVMATTGCVSPTAILGALSPKDPKVDRSFLTRQPCAPPCWYGLEPGKSNIGEVRQVLKTLEFVDQSSVKEYGSTYRDKGATEIHWGCTHPVAQECGIATISGGHLVELLLDIQYPLTFQDAVDQLGPPDYISQAPYAVEVGGCIVALYWPERGIYADKIETHSDDPCRQLAAGKSISRTLGISFLVFEVPNSLKGGPDQGLPYAPWPGFSGE